MENISLHIHQGYKGFAPAEWFHAKSVNIQRLYYINGGTGFMLTKNGKEPLLPGKFYLFASNLAQEFRNDPDDPIDHIYFDFYSTPPIISPGPLVFDASSGRLKALAEFLDASVKHRSDCPLPHDLPEPPSAPRGSDGEYSQLLHELLRVSLLTLSDVREIPFMTDRIVSDTLEFIRTNYSEPIGVKEMSSRLGFDQNYFIRRFKELTGGTPYAYLNTYRLEKARELIASGETIARAASLVGYENASSLSRALKITKCNILCQKPNIWQ